MKHLIILEITDKKPIQDWAALLMGERHGEALESIRREHVSKENVFYFELEGKKYLGFYIEGEMKPADMTMPINQEHQKVLQSVKVKRIESELLYLLED